METLVRGFLFIVSGVAAFVIIVAVLEHMGVQTSTEVRILGVLGVTVVMSGISFLVRKMYK